MSPPVAERGPSMDRQILHIWRGFLFFIADLFIFIAGRRSLGVGCGGVPQAGLWGLGDKVHREGQQGCEFDPNPRVASLTGGVEVGTGLEEPPGVCAWHLGAALGPALSQSQPPRATPELGLEVAEGSTRERPPPLPWEPGTQNQGAAGWGAGQTAGARGWFLWLTS